MSSFTMVSLVTSFSPFVSLNQPMSVQPSRDVAGSAPSAAPSGTMRESSAQVPPFPLNVTVQRALNFSVDVSYPEASNWAFTASKSADMA